ncbi:MAG: glycosyltransferase family 39 protein [Terriglobales bacterium]
MNQPSESRLIAAVLVVITLCAAALRFHAVGIKTFWFDEGVSVAIARLDPYNFLRILWRREANMSLYYALLHIWLWMGNSEAFVRSFSVIFAIATIPAIYFLGRRLFDSRTGLITAGLLSVNAFHVCYSQEARSYSLMVLLCVLSSLYFLKTIESSRYRYAYVVLSTLAIYAHFYSLLLIAAQYLWLRYLAPKAMSSEAIGARTWKTISLLVSPILIFVATTGAGPLKWIPRPGLKDLWNFAVLITGHGGVILAITIGVLATLGAYPAMRKKSTADDWPLQFLIVWLSFPILLVLFLSIFRPLFLSRYFIFCLPPLLLLVAAGLGRIRPLWQVPLLVLCLALSFRGTTAYYIHDFDNERDDWRFASNYILQNAQPGDALLFHVPMGRMPYDYYVSLDETPLLPSAPQVLYPHHGPRITFLDFVEKPDYVRLSDALPQYRRVWVVISHAGTPSGLDRVATNLTSLAQTGHTHGQQFAFKGIDVFLYQ